MYLKSYIAIVFRTPSVLLQVKIKTAELKVQTSLLFFIYMGVYHLI